MHVDNVNIEAGSNRISYRVYRGDTRAQRSAIKKIKKGTGTSVKDVPSDISKTNAYTQMIADASTTKDLLQHLRKNNVEFKAVATSSASSATSTVAPSSSAMAAGKDNILPTLAMGAIVYRMYKNGGISAPSGSSKGGPGTFSRKKNGNDTKKATTFDDIEGIDSAKHDVMELVDTLRNPDKYSLVGTPPPTDCS